MPSSFDAPFTAHKRRRGFRTIERVAEEGRSGTAALITSLSLARRAGRVVAPILRPFGMSTDFTEGHARVENGTLVLLAQTAVQANRIRNLSKRLTQALATEGLPLYAIECRVLPKHVDDAPPQEPSGPARHPSRTGAAALLVAAQRVKDPKLRASLEKLAAVVAPRPEEAVPEALRTVERLQARLMQGVCAIRDATENLPAAPDASLIPEKGAVAADPGLAGVRERMLARLHARRALEERCEKLSTEATHFDARLTALDVLHNGGAVAPDTFWTAERLTELDLLRADIVRWAAEAQALAEELTQARRPKAPLPPPIRMAAPPEEMRREKAGEAQFEANFRDLMREVYEMRMREDAARLAAALEDAEGK